MKTSIPTLGSSGAARTILVAALAASPARAQTCFESDPPLPVVGDHPTLVALGDFDGDGDLDQAAYLALSYTSVSLRHNTGGGTWSGGYQQSIGLNVRHIAFLDVDGDGDDELVQASQSGTVSALRYSAGSWSGAGSVFVPGSPNHFAGGDFDGDGDLDLAVAAFGSSGSGLGMARVLFNQGAGAFVLGPGILADAMRVAAGDFDADGDLDLAIVRATDEVLVARNDGSGGFPAAPTSIPLGAASNDVLAADLDGDGRADLAVAQADDRVSILLATPAGFAPRVDIQVSHAALGLTAGDLDEDGDVDLVVRAYVASVLANDGSGRFAAAGALDVAFTGGADVGDVDGDGDVDLALSESGLDAVRILRSCAISGTPTCFGDGSATACPCGNASPVGAKAGCLHSLGVGGTLRASGAASIAADSLVLLGASMPDAPALYFQGTSATSGVFGDGLRCATGTVTRLGIATSSGGASRYPAVGQPSVSVRGAVTTPGDRHYQVWYRNAASFCTPSGFNLTNSLRVAWRL